MEVAMEVVPRRPRDLLALRARQASATPYLRGFGEIDLTCGGCGEVLAQSLAGWSQLALFVLECPRCRRLNQPPPAPHSALLVDRPAPDGRG